MKRIIRYKIDEICKQYFLSSNFDFFFDRIRSAFFFRKIRIITILVIRVTYK